MRIAALPSDRGAVGAYRVRWPAQHLADHGHPITIDTPVPRTTYRGRSEVTDGQLPPPWVEILASRIDADVLVIQRPMHRQWLDIIPMLQAQGVRVMIDVDDDLDRVDPGNVTAYDHRPHWVDDVELAEWESMGRVRVTRTVTAEGPMGAPRRWHYTPDIEGSHHRDHLRVCIAMADQLVVSTPALARHYGPLAQACTVVQNCVPAHYLDIGRANTEGNPLRVGWTGSVKVHPKDLQVVGRGLANVRRPYRFYVIGDGGGVEEAIGRRPDIATQWLPLAEYPFAYATLDVVLCALTGSKFNASKSWLKAIEAAALGVVPIMSPSPEYLALHAEGVGLVARNPVEWTRAIEFLIDHPIERHRLRARGLEVASAHTIEGNSSLWWRAWSGLPAVTIEKESVLTA